MFRAVLASAASIAALGTVIVACSSGGSSNGTSLSNAVDGATVPGATLPDGGTTPGPVVAVGGNAHTPASGCRSGFEACTAKEPAVCAHLDDDYDHCGACNRMCQMGTCVDGECSTDAGTNECSYGMMCDGACVHTRRSNADHCGSCFNRCASNALCVNGACEPTQGDGTSCTSPVILDVEAVEKVGFRLDFSPASTFVHPCGPLEAIPTRWFRFTGPKSKTNVSVDSSVAADKLVVTVFSSSACNESVVVGCSNDKTEPQLDLPNAEGKTFFVAVGAVSVTAGARATIRIDH